MTRSICHQIKVLRTSHNISQRQLAEMTGIKQQMISRIERADVIPSLASVTKLLEALGYEIKIVPITCN